MKCQRRIKPTILSLFKKSLQITLISLSLCAQVSLPANCIIHEVRVGFFLIKYPLSSIYKAYVANLVRFLNQIPICGS